MLKIRNAMTIHGDPLRYGLPFPGHSDLFRTYVTKSFLNQLRQPIKEHLPVFDLWSLRSIKLIVADYDELPMDFIHEEDRDWREGEAWEHYRQYLEWRYGRLGLVLPSPSGKAKILFKVHLSEGVQMNPAIAHDTLDYLLDQEDRVMIDRRPVAAQRFFMNEVMFKTIQKGGLEEVPVHPAVLDSLDNVPEYLALKEGRLPEPRRWDLIPADAPEFNPLIGTLKNEAEWFLVRILASSPRRALQGIDLPQPFIVQQSEQALERPLSLAATCRAIKSFVGQGFLKVVDEGYYPGRRGKRYCADGILVEILNNRLTTQCSTKIRPVVDSIPDGKWESVFWMMTNYFSSEGDYLQWAYSLPGVDKKGKNRRKKAQRAWRAHVHPRFNNRKVA